MMNLKKCLKAKNIPNILTTFRICLIPFFLFFLLVMDNFKISSTIFLISGITDILDGWIARKFNLVSRFGKVYDPLADKITEVFTIFALYFKNVLPVWLTLLIAAKEMLMILFGLVLYIIKANIYSNWCGKAGTLMFYGIIFFLMNTKEIRTETKEFLYKVLAFVVVFPIIGYLNKRNILKMKSKREIIADRLS